MNPREEYTRRLGQRRETFAQHQRGHIRIGQVRLAIFAVAALIAWASYQEGVLSAWWLLAPLILFVAVLAYHQRLMRRMECARRAVDFYERAMDRLDGKWAGRGESGARFRNPQHPYADDLDLFVPGGVFEMLSAARTRAGENTLASWLTQPAAIETARGRHQAIAELRDRIDLREDLFVLGQDFTAGVNPEALVQWAIQPLEAVSRAQAALLKMLGAAGIVTLGFLLGTSSHWRHAWRSCSWCW